MRNCPIILELQDGLPTRDLLRISGANLSRSKLT